ncbi:hypothetical protein [Marivita sp. S0852]
MASRIAEGPDMRTSLDMGVRGPASGPCAIRVRPAGCGAAWEGRIG